MPAREPVACMICGAGTARNGKHPNKYCDNHIQDGIARGHINSKRARPASPASSASTSTSAGRLPEGWKLLELKKIYGSRFYSEDFDTVDLENGLIQEAELVMSLEYLLVGKFERRQGDTCGPVMMCWLTASDLVASSLSDEQVDAAVQQWEADEARRRALSMSGARDARDEDA